MIFNVRHHLAGRYKVVFNVLAQSVAAMITVGPTDRWRSTMTALTGVAEHSSEQSCRRLDIQESVTCRLLTATHRFKKNYSIDSAFYFFTFQIMVFPRVLKV